MFDGYFSGMLTVEPAKRLKMEDLLDNLWLEGGMGGLLATPSILIKSQRGETTIYLQKYNYETSLKVVESNVLFVHIFRC